MCIPHRRWQWLPHYHDDHVKLSSLECDHTDNLIVRRFHIHRPCGLSSSLASYFSFPSCFRRLSISLHLLTDYSNQHHGPGRLPSVRLLVLPPVTRLSYLLVTILQDASTARRYFVVDDSKPSLLPRTAFSVTLPVHSTSRGVSRSAYAGELSHLLEFVARSQRTIHWTASCRRYNFPGICLDLRRWAVVLPRRVTSSTELASRCLADVPRPVHAMVERVHRAQAVTSRNATHLLIYRNGPFLSF